MKLSILFTCSLLLLFASCKKDNNSSPGGSSGTGTKLYRIQIGTDPATDTVYHVTLNSDNTINTIQDSIFAGEVSFLDTLTATYAAGKITGVSDLYGYSASYQYNASGQLTQMDSYTVGQHDRYVYSFNNGVLASKIWTSDEGQGGALLPQETFTYVVTNGNITERKEYDNSNNLLSDIMLTYGSQANPFKELALFNVSNVVGTEVIADNPDSYFNTNILAGISIAGSPATITNTFNSGQLPTKVTALFPPAFYGQDELFTWQFSYH